MPSMRAYVLISILSALHEGEFTLDEVQGTLQMLFEKQYILTEEVIVETRYRTETDTWTDADGNTHTETYRVPYDYYICNVKLENFNLSHVPVYIMSQEQLSMYATYMSVLGNREDLFGDSPYVDKYITNPPADYDVNPEYLNDEKFATLITEAEKYLGYPYVQPLCQHLQLFGIFPPDVYGNPGDVVAAERWINPELVKDVIQVCQSIPSLSFSYNYNENEPYFNALLYIRASSTVLYKVRRNFPGHSEGQIVYFGE